MAFTDNQNKYTLQVLPDEFGASLAVQLHEEVISEPVLLATPSATNEVNFCANFGKYMHRL